MKKCLFIYGNQNIEDLFDSQPSKINLNAQWIVLKKYLQDKGIELLSQKKLGSERADLELHLNVWEINRDDHPKFAILAECKFIHPKNSNVELLSKYDQVFSWDSDIVSLSNATKIQLAHPLGSGLVNGFKNRDKLVVLFGSNRSLRGWHPKNNLYSERVKTIKWFEKNAFNDFNLYGKKWNLSPRLPTKLGGIIHSVEKRLPINYKPFPSWKGVIIDKQEILKTSKFSIVYENIQGLNGYITEKIFDAFVSGNVPIYWGAVDVENYIPADCFINRCNFKDHDQLFKYLKNMSEEKYIVYQNSIKKFLNYESSNFTCEKFAETISSKIIKRLNDTT